MLKKLTERIYYMPHNNDTDRPILGLVCGDKYSLIVDSGNSPQHAKEFLAEVKSLNIPPVKYLVITHWHFDHVFGIKEMNLTTIGHENTKIKLEEMRNMKWDDASLEVYLQNGILNEFEISCIKKEIPERDSFLIGDLDITYKGSMAIDLGGINCIINDVGGDHTLESTVIYIPEEKVIFLGDCVYNGRYNGDYVFTKEKLFPMIDKIEKNDIEYYFCSHESICDKEEMDGFWHQLKSTGNIVEKGTSVEEAKRKFTATYKRPPSEAESFFIGGFVNGNKSMKEKAHH
ncbi:MBL fold metallo-hydrolase [Bacillus sp. SM2101]|uniref:MBL fold metallo-hydrolase n=1 Tax=Bacillus sp. SM2101 TaxID=2805366 RepID=UPI001BDF07F5|nr:MBL fold metallo-hydrolase [Bacillus sp. SM2101]